MTELEIKKPIKLKVFVVFPIVKTSELQMKNNIFEIIKQ